MGQNEDTVLAKDIMGTKGILKKYVHVFGKDLIVPIIITVILLVIAYKKKIYSPVVLGEAIKVGLVVIPVLLSVLVAGYVLLLTIYFSGNIDTFKKDEKGRNLLYSISANYAFCIISSILALVITIIMSFFFEMKLTSDYHVCVNYLCSGMIYLLLFFTLKNLRDLVLALFDFGQSFIFEKQLNNKSGKGVPTKINKA